MSPHHVCGTVPVFVGGQFPLFRRGTIINVIATKCRAAVVSSWRECCYSFGAATLVVALHLKLHYMTPPSSLCICTLSMGYDNFCDGPKNIKRKIYNFTIIKLCINACFKLYIKFIIETTKLYFYKNIH